MKNKQERLADSGGFTPYPNTYHDSQNLGAISELPREVLERRVDEYGKFMQRTDVMPRGRALGERILNHLLFEMAWQDGVYHE